MKVGIATQGFVGPDGDPRQRIREVIREAQYADEVGLNAFGVSEQHFKFPTNSTGAVDVIMAAVAQTTERIRIRPCVVILPLHHPLNVAERWAAIDVLSNGRVDFAIGRGNTPLTAEAYEVPVPETGPRTLEALEIVLKAWREPAFEFRGKFNTIAPIALTPKPVQRPHPPVIWAATSPTSHEECGRLGLALFTSTNAITWEQTERRVQRYLTGLEHAEPLLGMAPTKRVIIQVNGHCAASFEQARREVADYVMGYVNRTIVMYEQFVKRSGQAINFEQARAFKDNFDLIAHGSPAAFGSPDQVIESLHRIHALGADEVDILYDGATHEQHMECIRLLGEVVQPAVAHLPEHDHPLALASR